MSRIKDPAGRAHIWERPAPAEVQTDVDREYPKHLHKAGEAPRVVANYDDEQQALKDGYTLDVPLTKEQKKAVAAQSREKASNFDV